MCPPSSSSSSSSSSYYYYYYYSSHHHHHHHHHSYSRIGNPTNTAFEERIAALEGGVMAVATSSGEWWWQ